MTKNGDKVTIREVYTLIESSKSELKTDLLRLENKFDNLEAGRLTRLEHDFNETRSELSNTKGKLFAITTIIALVISLIGAILGFFLKT